MALGNKLYSPAHAAEHVTFQLVGNPGTEQCHRNRAVDKPRIQAL